MFRACHSMTLNHAVPSSLAASCRQHIAAGCQVMSPLSTAQSSRRAAWIAGAALQVSRQTAASMHHQKKTGMRTLPSAGLLLGTRAKLRQQEAEWPCPA